MTSSARRRRGWLGERGQAMVEFALIVPMLLIVLFGIIDLGAALYDQVTLASAAQDGARTGAINGDTAAAANAAVNAVKSPIGCSPAPSASPAPTIGGTPKQIQVTLTCKYNGITPLGHMLGITLFPSGITASANAKVEQ